MLKSEKPKLSSHSHHYNILMDCYRQDLLMNPAWNRGLLPFRVAAQHDIPGENRDCVYSGVGNTT
jgi:hypothetical protein